MGHSKSLTFAKSIFLITALALAWPSAGACDPVPAAFGARVAGCWRLADVGTFVITVAGLEVTVEQRGLCPTPVTAQATYNRGRAAIHFGVPLCWSRGFFVLRPDGASLAVSRWEPDHSRLLRDRARRGNHPLHPVAHWRAERCQ